MPTHPRKQSNDTQIVAEILKDAAEPRQSASVKEACEEKRPAPIAPKTRSGNKGRKTKAASRSAERGEGVTWTTEKPTQTGWYWYKGDDPDRKFHADGISIVEVITEAGRLVCRHSNCDNQWVKDSQAQWAGPLEPPE